MAVTNRNSLVLNGVNVVRDVVMGTMGTGRNTVIDQTAASPSSSRLQSQQVPQSEAREASCLPDAWRIDRFMADRRVPADAMALQRLHHSRLLALQGQARKLVKPAGYPPAGGAPAALRHRAES
jgi:hypothetical protein